MSNRAWMPLHITDYLADTGHLTAAEHGAYLLLIMHYWQNAGLPENERMIARIARMDAAQWEESREVIAMLFGPGWTHKRIDAELAKADEVIQKRRAAANARHQGSKSNADAVHVQSKCSDTGALPLTDNHSSSLRSEEAAAARNSSPAGFADFWAIYPNKVGKRDAEKAFSKARKRADLATILAGLRAYVAKTDDRPWCNPATWLNQDRWEDRPATPPPRLPAYPPEPRNVGELTILEAKRGDIFDAPFRSPRLDDESDRNTGFAGTGIARRIAIAAAGRS